MDQNSEDNSFVETPEQEIEELLSDRKSKNTKRSMETALRRLRGFLKLRSYPELEDIPTDDLPAILTKFYTDVRKKKDGTQYQTSSFKVLRAGLNRYFKVERNLDIVADEKFMRCNLVFNGV